MPGRKPNGMMGSGVTEEQGKTGSMLFRAWCKKYVYKALVQKP